ncbi:hypothetical protein C5F51_36070 [Nocardia nova]|uniref:DUF4396 domain-containing protein n=2 Tax=Nocardia nova TaxID=37330 RepID=A0A2S5ZUY8_9NOCA|nr:hypothetical protein C5F51_36070 [Nocardia nova]
MLSWTAIGAGCASAAAILYDITIARHRQPMAIMTAVWPITALYSGPLGVLGYARLGRTTPKDAPSEQTSSEAHGSSSRWRSGILSASHCGAGCTLGDIIGGWLIFATGWTLFGERLFAEYVVEFVLAWSLGIAFQYFSIAPMRPDMPARRALANAIKADTLSIVAFQVGMYAWMALVTKVFFHEPLPINGPEFWFMMQIGLLLGILTTYPVNLWLVHAGIKEAM